MSSLHEPSDLDHTASLDALQGKIAQHTAEQEKELGDLQGLVGAALAVPKEAVQPIFEALGKRHLSMLAEQQKLQLQPHLVTAVIKCIGGYLTQRRDVPHTSRLLEHWTITTKLPVANNLLLNVCAIR